MPHIEVVDKANAEGELQDIYDDIQNKRGKLANVHMIQSLHPQSIVAHMQLYMEIMFSKSPLSRAEREMIAVVVSATNGCSYCQAHHGAALIQYWKTADRVELLKQKPLEAAESEREKALCQYAIGLTLHPDDFEGVNRTENLRLAGLEDRAILDATLVVGYFNFVNRIVLGLGVEMEPHAGTGFKY
jgi:uncharacterized peroxidase-related enzyme